MKDLLPIVTVAVNSIVKPNNSIIKIKLNKDDVISTVANHTNLEIEIIPQETNTPIIEPLNFDNNFFKPKKKKWGAVWQTLKEFLILMKYKNTLN